MSSITGHTHHYHSSILTSSLHREGKVNMSHREIVMGVTIEIKEIIIKVQTQPPKDKPEWSPLLQISMKDIAIQSTNAKAEVSHVISHIPPNFPRNLIQISPKFRGGGTVENQSGRSERAQRGEHVQVHKDADGVRLGGRQRRPQDPHHTREPSLRHGAL